LDKYRISHPHLFWRQVRVQPVTFDYLVGLIENHFIFHNNSNHPQIPVSTQLAIFLNRAGHYGNRAGPQDIAEWAGVSTGTVHNSTRRVMTALLSLHDEVFQPLDEEESRRAGQYVEERTCPSWKGGKLTGDGTTLPLFERPGLHGDVWYDRKSNYSLNAQVRIHIHVHFYNS
jgi:hypothetical protein